VLTGRQRQPEPEQSPDALDQAWPNARLYILSKCSAEQQIIFASLTSPEVLLQRLERLQSRSGGRLLNKSVRRVRPFFDAISQYEHTWKILSNAHLATVLLWGTLNQVFTVSVLLTAYACKQSE
jgi:hypothetical protein